MVTAAIALFIQVRMDTTAEFTTVEVAALAFAVLFPITLLLQHGQIPVGTVSLALLFVVIVRAHGHLSPPGQPRLRGS
jgi:hypothetical protein